jgi:hypothetical protein
MMAILRSLLASRPAQACLATSFFRLSTSSPRARLQERPTGLTVQHGSPNKEPSVLIGNQALATTATDGFLYIPTCAGTPTRVPTAFTGLIAMIYIRPTINSGSMTQGETAEDAGSAALVTCQ